MNKILTAGLLAAVMSTASFAECGTHGFYVGVNFGADFSRVKILQGELSVTKDSAGTEQTVYTPNSVKTDKSKTKFHTELAFGFDRAFECVVLGVDVTAGMTFGKTKLDNKLAYQCFDAGVTLSASIKTIDQSSLTSKFRVNNLWYARVAPRVGFMLNPEIELYATFGAKVHQDKLNYSFSDNNGAVIDDINGSPKKIKTSAFVGLGTRYNVCPNLFVKAEYRYELNKSLHLPSVLTKVAQSGAYSADALGTGSAGYELGTDGAAVNRISQRAHVAELGLGYRF